MIRMGLLVLLLTGFLVGCAGTKLVTLKNGDVLRAKSMEETSSTYVIVEEESGRKTTVPKGAVKSIK